MTRSTAECAILHLQHAAEGWLRMEKRPDEGLPGVTQDVQAITAEQLGALP